MCTLIYVMCPGGPSTQPRPGNAERRVRSRGQPLPWVANSASSVCDSCRPFVRLVCNAEGRSDPCVSRLQSSVICRDQIVLVAESHLHSSLSPEIQFPLFLSAGTNSRLPSPARPVLEGVCPPSPLSTSPLVLASTSLAVANHPTEYRQRECRLFLFFFSVSV